MLRKKFPKNDLPLFSAIAVAVLLLLVDVSDASEELVPGEPGLEDLVLEELVLAEALLAAPLVTAPGALLALELELVPLELLEDIEPEAGDLKAELDPDENCDMVPDLELDSEVDPVPFFGPFDDGSSQSSKPDVPSFSLSISLTATVSGRTAISVNCVSLAFAKSKRL